MKRIISIALIFIIAATLSSCGGTPKNMSSAMYQIGLNALELTDNYIEGKITGEEAQERINEFYSQAESEYDRECRDRDVENLVGSDVWKDSSITHDLFMLHLNIGSTSKGYGAMSDVRKSRDNLAEDLGK